MLPDIVWIRPWFWLALPVLWYVIWRFQRLRLSKQETFLEWFDPHIFEHLSQHLPTTQKRGVGAALYCAALCLTIFLAGPAVNLIDNERFIEKRGAVIVFDLGLQSLVTDLLPNRLQQARYKIEDLLTSSPNYEYGFIVVGGDAYTVTPLSPDHSTLINQLSSLHPDILPTESLITDVTQLDKGVSAGAKLLSSSGYEDGVILVVSYNPTEQMLTQMTEQKGSFSLAYWQFGTPEGGPIKLSNDKLAKDENDNITILRALPPQTLPSALTWLPTSSSSEDIDKITALIGEQDSQLSKDIDVQFELLTPIDSYFLLPVLLIILAFIRKPNLILGSYLLIALVFVPYSGFTQVNANNSDTVQQYTLPELNIPLDWRPDSLMTQEQLSMRYFNQQNYQKSLQLAQSDTMKSMASLAMNDFEQAKYLLKNPQSPLDHYHLGLAHFALKEYEQALQAFENAIQIEPNMFEAQENFAALKHYLEQGENNQNQNNQGKNGNQESNSQNQSQQSEQQLASSDANNQEKASNDTPIAGRSERQRASKSGGQGSQSMGENSSTDTEKSNFFDDLFISKDKTYGDVDEEDIVQTELFGNLKERPPLDLEGINTVVRKLPNDSSFLLKQRLKLIHEKKQREKADHDNP